MSFSASVLANIKKIEETDEEEAPNGTELLEVLNEVPDETHFKVDGTNCVDPLLANVEVFVGGGYGGEYEDQDFINECSDDDAAPPRNKRGRTQNDLTARNGCIWSTTKDPTTTTESAIQQLQAIGKGPAHVVSNPLEVWHLLIDEQILAAIVQHTNDEIKQRRSKSAYQRATDLTELRAWLGLNYLCGIFRNSPSNGPLDELWSLELGNAIFRATMSVKRFEFLTDSVRFSAITKSKKADYTPIMDLWNKFLINCRSYYAASGNCVIDKLTLDITATNQATHMLTLCDSKTLYMCNAALVNDTATTEHDLLRLVADIKGTNRNIVLNEQYMNVGLANSLLESQLTAIGALPTTASDIPHELLSSKVSRKLYSANLGLITNEGNTGFLLTSGLPGKINAGKLYNLSVGACQRYQQAADMYSTRYASASPAQVRSALQFFYCILDFAALNAWVLLRLSEKGDGQMQQRDFQRHLGLYLTQQQLKRQLQSSSRLTMPQKIQVAEVLGEPTSQLLSTAQTQATKKAVAATLPKNNLLVPEGVLLLTKKLEKRARCRLCPGKNSPKTKTRCQQCLRPLCQRHFILRCRTCTGVEEAEPNEQAKDDPLNEDNDSSS